MFVRSTFVGSCLRASTRVCFLFFPTKAFFAGELDQRPLVLAQRSLMCSPASRVKSVKRCTRRQHAFPRRHVQLSGAAHAPPFHVLSGQLFHHAFQTTDGIRNMRLQTNPESASSSSSSS